jgi:ATP adenylyltransferase/5',5'''-P-1,P-4-tetraphosphate phosphorylase II
MRDERYFAVFEDSGNGGALAALSAELLAQQRTGWQALADGYTALDNALTREIHGVGWGVQLQCNPRRIVSSAAKLDAESIKNRPCFLCDANLPAEQKAILYRNSYNILCNPAPIFPGHYTIAATRHTPQSLADNLETLLLLADDFGAGTTVFYNGPRAGASAPDHLHFQAAPTGRMPIEKDVQIQIDAIETQSVNGVTVFRTKGLGRGILVFRGTSASSIIAILKRTLLVLAARRGEASAEEPPVNIFCSRIAESWQLLLFPRLKLRPDAFFEEGEGRIVVSPGSADMGGVIITPREQDFHSLTAATVAGIYQEVAFDDGMTGDVLAAL